MPKDLKYIFQEIISFAYRRNKKHFKTLNAYKKRQEAHSVTD